MLHSMRLTGIRPHAERDANTCDRVQASEASRQATAAHRFSFRGNGGLALDHGILQNIKKGWQSGYRLRVCTGGKRHSVWLGTIREREAITIKLHVEAVIESTRLKTPLPAETQRWLRELQPDLRKRLSDVLGTSKTVDEAVEAYIAHVEATHKATTARGSSDTLDQFAAHFGTTLVRSLTGDQIDAWLRQQNVAASTIGKHVKHLRSWLRWCERQRFVDSLPTIATSAAIGTGEKQYIEFERFQRIIDHFQGDGEMQAVLALARWCGLRIASEVVTLRVSSVDLAADRLLIDDSKRSHRQSRGPPVIRKLPLFSGVRPYLMPLLKRKCNPNDYLLPTLGGQDPQVVGSLLRQRVYRAIDSLGMDRWPRVFHSVRATRQTQLKELFGEKVACDWVGNSTDVFRQNYELIDDEIFTRAVES